MVRALLYVLAIVAVAAGLSWLADRPGELVINWQGYEIQTSVFRAIVMAGLLAVAAIAIWSVARQILTSPATVGHFFRRRRQERGLEALSAGMIAVGSGDRDLARQYARLAHKSMPNEPLTQLLRAQTAQLNGDRATARRIYESMRNNPGTELLGLRGLYLEAQQEKEPEAARQYAERAVALNPRLGWSVESLFAMQCKDADWSGALDTLAQARKNGQIDGKIAGRRRAVLLTAQAVEAEESDAARALSLATEAHGLAPDLVPAAAVAGRLLASQGATPRAARILQRTWRRSPHPDIAAAYAYARIGDSPRDRLARIKELAHLTPHSDEGQIAVAVAAIDAQDWEGARRALRHLIEGKPSQRVCTLMARIEGGQHGDTGKVREWLARAVNAPRDPAWIADGHATSRWAPTSPVTGILDAYVWQPPPDTLERSDSDLLIEQLVPAKPSDTILVDKAKVIEAEEVPAAPVGPRAAESRPPKPMLDRQPRPDEATGRENDGQAHPGHPSGLASAIPPIATPASAAASTIEPTAARVPAPLRSTINGPSGNAKAGPSGASHPKSAVAGSGSAAVTRMQTGTPDRNKDRSSEKSPSVFTSRIDPLNPLQAPDDPGPDISETETDEGRAPMTRFRTPAAK